MDPVRHKDRISKTGAVRFFMAGNEL